MRPTIRLPRIPRPHWPRRASRPDVPAAVPAVPGGVLRIFRAAALIALSAVITAASCASFAESYRGLWLWAGHHSLSGFWQAAFPLQVDAFIVAGELTLFLAMTDRWTRSERAGAWAVALLGLAVSVMGNIGHVAVHDLQSRGTAAVPPLSAFCALWLGLTVLKRIISHRAGTVQSPASQQPPAAAVAVLPATVAAEVPQDAEHAALLALRATLAAGNGYSNNQLMSKFGLTRAQVTKIRRLAADDPDDRPADDADLSAA